MPPLFTQILDKTLKLFFAEFFPALKIAELRFSLKERLTSNCSETRGKTALDRVELEQIRTDVFGYWPLEGKESFEDAWRYCRRAVDEGGRLLN